MAFNLLPLYDEWTPPILKVRKRELNILQKSISFPIPENFWISGGKGYGKTLTIKKFYVPLVNNMNDAHAIYMGITKTKVSELISDFAIKIMKKKSDDIQHILNYIIKKNDVTKYVFIFDDIQRITHIRRDFCDILFQIHEFFKPFAEKKICQVLLVSQLSYQQRLGLLDGSTSSRFQFNPLMFSTYTKPELVDLYNQRIQYVGNGIDSDVCNLIAEEVNHLGSDFRYGLSILRESIHRFNQLDQASIAKAIEHCKTGWIEETIFSILKPHHTFLLYILALMSSDHYQWKIDAFNEIIDEGVSPPIALDDLRLHYRRQLKKIGIKPMSDIGVWRAIESMWEKGLIDKFSLTRKHPYNYRKKQGLFVRLKGNVANDISAIKVDWKGIL